MPTHAPLMDAELMVALRSLERIESDQEAELRAVLAKYALRRTAQVEWIDDRFEACTCGHPASKHDPDDSSCSHHDCSDIDCTCWCECTQYAPAAPALPTPEEANPRRSLHRSTPTHRLT